MRVDDFDFDLPEASIALRPARPRDSARLLHVDASGHLADKAVLDLPDLLRAGDLLVFNDTRVIPAALVGTRAARELGGGGDVSCEINLHKRAGPDRWRAFIRPAKRLKIGDRIEFGSFSADVIEKGAGGDTLLAFDQSGALLEDGSVAAPTAGLHFTGRLFDALAARGVERCDVTLHVGAGTFLPVKAEDTADHRMHGEWCTVSEQAANAINTARLQERRVIAVGTTALRTLESLAPEVGRIEAGSRDTEIFITPGYDFRITDALLTNFHLPRSTLFMLVSALAGLDTMQRAYAHAISSGYRFYSYGDTSLLERAR